MRAPAGHVRFAGYIARALRGVRVPEMPEVETVRRGLLAGEVVDGVVEQVWHDGSRKFWEAERLAGRRLLGVDRRGKYLIFPLDDGRELIVHLGMTGQLTHQRADAVWLPPERYRVAARLRRPDGSRGALLLGDVRGFGRVAVREPGEYAGLPTLKALGVEPLSEQFTATGLLAGLRRSSQSVYQVLLSQRVVSGGGSIYLTEALHLAGVDPRKPANKVTLPQAKRLREALVQTISAGIDNGGTTLRDYRQADGTEGANQHHLLAYGREGEPCATCGRALRRVVLGGRAAIYCPRCQR